jgi:hypothetical protein
MNCTPNQQKVITHTPKGRVEKCVDKSTKKEPVAQTNEKTVLDKLAGQVFEVGRFIKEELRKIILQNEEKTKKF